MRFLFAACLMFSLTACNKVSFSLVNQPVDEPAIAPVPNEPQDAPPVQAVCLDGESQWARKNGQMQCPNACPDGSFLQCKAVLEKELVCNSGRWIESGASRVAAVGDAIGSCPVAQPTPEPPAPTPEPPVVVNPPAPEPEPPVVVPPPAPQPEPEPPVVVTPPAPEPEPPVVVTPPAPEPPPVVVNPPPPVPQPPPAPISKTVSETFSVSGAGKADIVVLLDTSGSMNPNLAKLGQRFASLIGKLSGIDWQIGITNVEVGTGFWHGWAMNGKFMPLQFEPNGKTILTKNMKYADYYFMHTVTQDQMQQDPNTGDNYCNYQPGCVDMFSKPEPLRALKKSIENRNEPSNKGFFRQDAWLVPIIVTDADENENGAGAVQPDDVVSYYNSVLGSKMKGLMSFGIYIKPGDEACRASERNPFEGGWFGKFATVADRLVKKTGGHAVSICENDYGRGLADISEKVREKMSEIVLKDDPFDANVTVTFSPAPSPSIGWKRDGRKIVFDRTVPSGTKVTVTYQVKN